MRLPYPQQISSNPDVNASAMAWAAQLVDGLQKILSGTDGSLSFLQLAALGSHKVAFGSVTLTWAGATPVAGTQTVTHGLASAPFVYAISTSTSGGFAVAAYLPGAPGATTFTLNAYAQGGNPAAATTSTAYWLAIA